MRFSWRPKNCAPGAWTSLILALASRISYARSHQGRCIDALDQNRTKYTATVGIAPLREAVVRWHAQQLGSSYEPGESIICVGGKHAIYNAVSALIQEVTRSLFLPILGQLPRYCEDCWWRARFCPTQASTAFSLRAQQLEEAITPRPHGHHQLANNPTGAVIPPAEFEKIYEVCRRHDIWLMSDECYSHFTYGSARPYSVASIKESKPT